jgi:threonine aldolase
VAGRDWREVRAGCERFLALRKATPARELLSRLAEAVPPDAQPDRYGEGELLTGLEERVAELLGKEAAVVLPSGTMAQPAVLRVWCDRAGLDAIAFHPTCHLELHEERAYERLHGLQAVLVGDRNRLIGVGDLEQLKEPVAALLLELPQRELGGRLPDWDDLVAQAAWAREREVALHLDGARLWECGPYYGRPYAEIAALFDTVYVSFYKGLAGLSGCALAGPADVIAETRVWQVRQGGRVFQQFPLAIAATVALDRVLPRMPDFLAHARALADALRDLPGLDVVPDPPQVPMFHLHLRIDAERATEAALAIAEETRIWFGDTFLPTEVPAVQRFELAIGEPALEVSPDEARAIFAALLERA